MEKLANPPVTVPDASGEWKVRYVVDLQQIRAGDGKKVQNVSGGVLISMRQGQPQVNERGRGQDLFLGHGRIISRVSESRADGLD